MLDQLIQTLVESRNEAADDLLLQAIELGTDSEATVALEALLRRQTVHGLSGLIERYGQLSELLKLRILEQVKTLTPAIRACATGSNMVRRLSALRLIALGRQGTLTYLLIESMNHGDQEVSRAAVEALVGLSRWVATQTRRLQNLPARWDGESDLPPSAQAECREILEQRKDIESAVNRAIDIHRGAYGQELLRAALLLADRRDSQTLAILQTPKHGGQVLLLRRLQQPPASEHLEAFLLAASQMDLRGQFGSVFARIDEPPVLDALLRRTYWLLDHQLHLCMHQVMRGAWLDAQSLGREMTRRSAADAALIAEWIAASGIHDVMQDQLFLILLDKVRQDYPAKLRLLRIAARRPRNSSVNLLKELLRDTDERIVRLAAREIIRRQPPDFENLLLQLMSSATDSIRRVVGRAVGQSGFENYWQRFDELEQQTRQTAGRAMIKVLPGTSQRLERLLSTGPLASRLKAMQIVQELNLIQNLRPALLQLTTDQDPRLRSKAVVLLGQSGPGLPEEIIDRVLNDPDERVRANAVEVIDQRQDARYVPMLSRLARSRHNRERANAIKALHAMSVGTASQQLVTMLRDARPQHRISALWALKQVGLWQMLREVARLAKSDTDLRVRRYAIGVIRTVASSVEERKAKTAG